MVQRNIGKFEQDLVEAGYTKKEEYGTTVFYGPPVQLSADDGEEEGENEQREPDEPE
jgi:hypothetical protein